MTKNKKITVNTVKDYTSLGLHFLGYAGILAGVTVAAGSPVISGIAIATTLALNLGLGSYIKKAFSEALPERETVLSTTFNRASGRTPELQTKLHGTLLKITEFSKKLGLDDAPSFHFLDGDGFGRRRKKTFGSGKKEWVREGLREFLRTEFNKYANAAAFSHEKSSVLLSEPLAEKLDDNEVNAVMGHEVGHIAARHSTKKGLLSLLGAPAQMTAGLFSLVVTFASWKNFGLVIAGNAVGGLVAEGYKKLRNLNPDLSESDKVEFKRVESVLKKLGRIGMGVLFAAPDLVLAQSASLVVNESTKLLGKSYSRANEYQADRLAAEVTGNPMALATGLDKAREYNLSFEKGMDIMPGKADRNDSWLTSVFSKAKELYRTHPTNEKRRNQMEKMALAMTPSVS